MSNTMRGFDGDGMAVGTVTGIRWWGLDTTGFLYGARAGWKPGENTAECLALGVRHDPQNLPDEDCGCGFWGYWQAGAAPQAGRSRPVLGVIEGYGPTLIGDLGFRAAKAKIVALCPQFTIRIPDPDWKPPGARAYNPGHLFWRGPDGLSTWEVMVGHAPYSPAPMIDDDDALFAMMNQLEYDYQVPVYADARAMLLRYPPTTDYQAQPDPDAVAVATTFDTALQDAMKTLCASLDRTTATVRLFSGDPTGGLPS